MPEKVAVSFLEYLLSKSTISLSTAKQAHEIIAEVRGILRNPERNGGVTYSLYFGDQAGAPFYRLAWTTI